MPTYERPMSFASFTTARRIVAQLLVAGQHALHAQAVLAEERLELRGGLAGASPPPSTSSKPQSFTSFSVPGTSFVIRWRSV